MRRGGPGWWLGGRSAQSTRGGPGGPCSRRPGTRSIVPLEDSGQLTGRSLSAVGDKRQGLGKVQRP